MFYLIGGAPRSGKTTVAQKLSRKLNIPWISADSLELVAMAYTAEEKFDELFPKTTIRKKTLKSNDRIYAEFTVGQIVDAYMEQGKSLWPGLKSFIESEAKYQHDYILEGYHISPQLVSILKKDFPITSIFLGKENFDKTMAGLTENPQPNDWVIARTKDPATYGLITQMINVFSVRFKD